jgi:molecular chaperone DnaK
MSHRIIGIDLGTTNSVVATLDETGKPEVITNAQGQGATPSCVFIDHDGTPIVGTEAAHRGVVEPERFIPAAKRSIGSGEPVAVIDGTEYSAAKALSFTLIELNRIAVDATGETEPTAVVSHPANFTNAQKNELTQALDLAGTKSVLEVNEPTAGLVGLGVAGQGDGLALAIDVGGGTTDVSIAEIEGTSITIKMTGGVGELGGRDFDRVLIDRALESFRDLHGQTADLTTDGAFLQDLAQRGEHVKKVLSDRPSARIVMPCGGKVLDREITREEYAEATRPLVDRVFACVDRTLCEARITMEEIRSVHFIGAQTLDPAFGAMLKDRYGRTPWPKSDPLHCVAKGNVLLAQMELEKQGYRVRSGHRVLPPIDLSTRDITSHPIGIAALNRSKQLVQSVIIPRGHPIPAKRTERFTLERPGQTEAFIRVLEGEDDRPAEECQPLGHFMLEGAEAVRDRPHHIEILFRLDHSGMLSATARDPLSGAQAEMTIDYETSRTKPKPDPKPESTTEAKAS